MSGSCGVFLFTDVSLAPEDCEISSVLAVGSLPDSLANAREGIANSNAAATKRTAMKATRRERCADRGMAAAIARVCAMQVAVVAARFCDMSFKSYIELPSFLMSLPRSFPQQRRLPYISRNGFLKRIACAARNLALRPTIRIWVQLGLFYA